ncbi:hypothetical protein PPL_02849 [Heterostelium album PN500]|uniref:Uncharacterized protein n=1 Tax=Heterostelium pallidum (strain ATCC 26659 / Pp 5 / PN500) TaxID=670386 RepID=D3B383_HETP5|nr:hypothetical protein PPL_02849 [Heterostelium album PN500]EFA83781.1 hypothetical protein PPL_02849 [Heterostelium album PN500]|eukprot:XP_020435898.1 hypothetical protein PPL_02849 [Heterostelium album PN500]
MDDFEYLGYKTNLITYGINDEHKKVIDEFVSRSSIQRLHNLLFFSRNSVACFSVVPNEIFDEKRCKSLTRYLCQSPNESHDLPHKKVYDLLKPRSDIDSGTKNFFHTTCRKKLKLIEIKKFKIPKLDALQKIYSETLEEMMEKTFKSSKRKSESQGSRKNSIDKDKDKDKDQDKDQDKENGQHINNNINHNDDYQLQSQLQSQPNPFNKVTTAPIIINQHYDVDNSNIQSRISSGTRTPSSSVTTSPLISSSSSSAAQPSQSQSLSLSSSSPTLSKSLLFPSLPPSMKPHPPLSKLPSTTRPSSSQPSTKSQPTTISTTSTSSSSSTISTISTTTSGIVHSQLKSNGLIVKTDLVNLHSEDDEVVQSKAQTEQKSILSIAGILNIIIYLLFIFI